MRAAVKSDHPETLQGTKQTERLVQIAAEAVLKNKRDTPAGRAIIEFDSVMIKDGHKTCRSVYTVRIHFQPAAQGQVQFSLCHEFSQESKMQNGMEPAAAQKSRRS